MTSRHSRDKAARSTSIREHLNTAPLDPFLSLDDIQRIISGDIAAHVRAESLALGDYLPQLLEQIGWWMITADILFGEKPAHAKTLRQVRQLLKDTLDGVSDAWGETYCHSPAAPDFRAGTRLLSRYQEFRTTICRSAAQLLPKGDVQLLLRKA
jgi:hypothetical protein